jgi:hypothetical protein
LTSAEQNILKISGLADHAPAEAWTVTGSSRQLAYATHGIFRFFGKFPPPVATHLIAEHTSVHDVVLDPMCGSGTTGVECVLMNRRAVLGDVNPLALLLARVKTQPLDVAAFDDALARVTRAYRPLSAKKTGFEPVGLRNPDHWFLESTADSLRGLQHLIKREKEDAVRDALWVAFAGTVRRVSRATTQQGRLFLDAATALPDALDTFESRALRVKKATATLPEAVDVPNVMPMDIRELQTLEQTPLLILHPPYFNAYRYSSVNSLELAWLGWSHSDVRPDEIREFFKIGKAENVDKYIDDMEAAINSASTLITRGGVLALMIGDTTLQGQHIPVVRPLLERIGHILRLETIALRVPQFTEASWVTSQRRARETLGIKLMDYVLTFRKDSS